MKGLSTSLLFSQRIPENFLRKFGNEISPVATLHVSDGHIWRVGIRKADNKFWFYDGWQEFADHYSIGIGYFLIFRYEGTSIFNVYIFNLKTSELNYEPHSRGLACGEQYHQVRRYTLWNDLEDEESSDALDPATEFRSMTDSLKKKAVNSSSNADQLTLSRNFTPTATQSIFNGNMHPAVKSVVHSQTGVRPTAQEVLYSVGMKLKSAGDEMKLQSQGEEGRKPKKAGWKRRKIEASEFL